MKNNITELVFLLDCSGSMAGLESDTIGGFNTMIEKQKKQGGKCFVSTVLFNGESSVLHDRIPLTDVPKMTKEHYIAIGCTALMDALGDAIHHIGNIHKYARPEDVPAHILFVITTDGQENASHRYSSKTIKKEIEKRREMGWEFLFLGANMDAVETAAQYGIDEDRAVNFHADKEGTKLNFKALSKAIGSVRCGAPLSARWKQEIDEDYKKRK